MRKNRSIFVSLLMTLLLSSCYFFNPNYNKDSSSSSEETIDKVSFKTPENTSSFSKSNMNVNTVGAGFGYHYLPSTGDSKILVIPIETSDYSFTSYGSEWKTMLSNAFFGDETNTGWESVASFYEKSSYDQLHISGEVSPAIKFDMTQMEMITQYEKYQEKNLNYTDYILSSCIQTLSEKTDIKLSDYDSDGDGYIDAVWLVYAMPYKKTSNFLWAYTTWATNQKKTDGVYACCYSWASFQFLTSEDYRPYNISSYTNYADAHTYIHETGHMLGLDDYYSYVDGNTDTPMGGVDMMDFNIGDHTAFSKYLLGWITPTVITPEYLEKNGNTITLSSMTEMGDFLLLPIYKDGVIDYNDTPFDEYLLIEYYTPTGLNKSDVNGYGTSKLSTYSQPGVLVYHIDARIGKIIGTSDGNKWDGYVYDTLPKYGSDKEWGSTYTYTYIFNNTKSYSYVSNLDESGNYYRGRLISILPRSGKKIQGSYTGYSSITSLYRAGSAFNSKLYGSFRFDDGSSVQYGFNVKSTTSSECVLEFSNF
jgi:M6 family metalloprotease-like protein